METSSATRGKEGRIRNEDATYHDSQRGIFCVADGVGGSVRGDLASKAVTESLLKTRIREDSNERIREVFLAREDAVLDQHDVEEAMRRLVGIRIHDRVHALGGADTTLSLGKIWKNREGREKLTIANIGDSRIYRFRTGALDQLSKDDSVIQTLIAREVPDADGFPITDDADISRSVRTSVLREYGRKDEDLLSMARFADTLAKKEHRTVDRLTLEEMRHFVLKTVLFPEQTDVQTFDVERGDVYLAMSDGIHDNLTDEQIERIVEKHKDDLRQAARELIDEASAVSKDKDNIRAKPDDMTVVVVKI